MTLGGGRGIRRRIRAGTHWVGAGLRAALPRQPFQDGAAAGSACRARARLYTPRPRLPLSDSPLSQASAEQPPSRTA